MQLRQVQLIIPQATERTGRNVFSRHFGSTALPHPIDHTCSSTSKQSPQTRFECQSQRPFRSTALPLPAVHTCNKSSKQSTRQSFACQTPRFSRSTALPLREIMPAATHQTVHPSLLFSVSRAAPFSISHTAGHHTHLNNNVVLSTTRIYLGLAHKGILKPLNTSTSLARRSKKSRTTCCQHEGCSKSAASGGAPFCLAHWWGQTMSARRVLQMCRESSLQVPAGGWMLGCIGTGTHSLPKNGN